MFVSRHRYARISPRKIRLVADSIRSVTVKQALQFLRVSKLRGAAFFRKVLNSAIANAEYAITEKSLDVETDHLVVSKVSVDKGPTIKRWRPRSRGMAVPIRRRTSHLVLELSPAQR